jgi:mRNA interferase RelE/StbE
MYKLVFTYQGEKSLAIIDKQVSQRILNKLKWLIENFDSITPIPLQSNLSGFYKLRIGQWRAIYDVDYVEEIVTIHKVGHRKDIYKLL